MHQELQELRKIQEIRTQLRHAKWSVSVIVFASFFFLIISQKNTADDMVSEQDNRTKYTPPTAAIASVGPKIRKYANEKK